MTTMNRITISLIFLIMMSMVLPTSAIMYASGSTDNSDDGSSSDSGFTDDNSDDGSSSDSGFTDDNSDDGSSSDSGFTDDNAGLSTTFTENNTILPGESP